jgi:hypothetical protein
MKSIRRFGYFDTAIVLAATCVAATCVPAAAQTFSVDEGTVPGANANIVVADRISFNYASRIAQTLVGPTYDGDDPFSESGYLTKASFAIGGSAVPSQLNALGANGYGMYGLFTITGTSAQEGAGIASTYSSTIMTLLVDPAQDTTLGFAGNSAVTTGGTGDDYALANYTLIAGQAHLFGGLANGDSDTVLNIALTNNGNAFFVSPFFAQSNIGGNRQTVTGASLSSSFVASTTGAGTELFLAPIPEPHAVALLLVAGLGALGVFSPPRRGGASTTYSSSRGGSKR